MQFLMMVILMLLPLLAAPEHALYISVVHISCPGGEKPATVRVKVFADDLRDAIRNSQDRVQESDAAVFCEANRQAITRYFNRHLVCSFDSRQGALVWESATMENEAYFFRFLIPQFGPCQDFSIRADFLMELFPTQSNILRIEQGGEQHFGRVTLDRPIFRGRF